MADTKNNAVKCGRGRKYPRFRWLNNIIADAKGLHRLSQLSMSFRISHDSINVQMGLTEEPDCEDHLEHHIPECQRQ